MRVCNLLRGWVECYEVWGPIDLVAVRRTAACRDVLLECDAQDILLSHAEQVRGDGELPAQKLIRHVDEEVTCVVRDSF